MRRRAIALAAVAAALAAGAASAGPVRPDAYADPAPDDMAADYAGEEGYAIGPYFYPAGYDPQYGSAGRLPDAASFAASYGCRPIWNAKTGRRISACN